MMQMNIRDSCYFREKTEEMFQGNVTREEAVIAISLCERVNILQTTSNQKN